MERRENKQSLHQCSVRTWEISGPVPHSLGPVSAELHCVKQASGWDLCGSLVEIAPILTTIKPKKLRLSQAKLMFKK